MRSLRKERAERGSPVCACEGQARGPCGTGGSDATANGLDSVYLGPS